MEFKLTSDANYANHANYANYANYTNRKRLTSETLLFADCARLRSKFKNPAALCPAQRSIWSKSKFWGQSVNLGNFGEYTNIHTDRQTDIFI